jgi:SRSO17 transposase
MILPWVRIKNLASHILSRALKLLQKDWKEQYGVEPFVAETFVDSEKYKGTCYLAANWEYLGETKGFGKVGKAFVYHGNRKGVYIYIMRKGIIEKMKAERAKAEPRRRALNPAKRRAPNMMLHKPDWNKDILKEAGITEEMVMGLGQELSDFMAPFLGCINYSGQEIYAETFVKGFLSDLQYKSAAPIALRYGVSVRGSQRFLKDGKWDTAAMEAIYRARLSDAIARPGGMITVDESGEPKKGGHSVGVARQYCGALGKRDNCQVGVYVGYSGTGGYGLIDRRLFLPEKWFGEDHKSRRGECGVPEDIVFQTKLEIAIEMLGKVLSSGLFPARWAGVDSLYGTSKAFLAAIPKNLWYFADVKSNTLVFAERPKMAVPEYSGRGRRDLKPKPSIAPVHVETLAKDESLTWNREILGEGAKGPIVAHEKCIRVTMCDDGHPGETVWLYIRRFEDGSFKFAISNAPWDTSLHDIRAAAIMRWPIEQCFSECKNELGLDHCEARSWNAWHRHTLLVFLAHLFLTSLRLKYKKNTLY